MKICGTKVHDYYDACISQFGYSNEGNIFLREPTDIVVVPSSFQQSRYYKERKSYPHDEINFLVNDFTFDAHEYRDAEKTSWLIVAFRVLFAGKLYGGVKVKPTYSSSFIRPSENRELICYNWETLSEFLNKRGITIETERFSWFSEKRVSDAERLQQHFKVIDITDQCIAHKLVVAYIVGQPRSNSYNVELNGELKKHQFFKVLDPFTAYQELAMFVDGHLAYPGNTTIEIEDKYRIAAHGFDKRSFRKDPTKKRG